MSGAGGTSTDLRDCKGYPHGRSLTREARLTSLQIRMDTATRQESGDLYGIVPLARGMPVTLTDHIDRSQEKQLLRGRVGKIHSWVLAEGEKREFVDGVRILNQMPKAVLV